MDWIRGGEDWLEEGGHEEGRGEVGEEVGVEDGMQILIQMIQVLLLLMRLLTMCHVTVLPLPLLVLFVGIVTGAPLHPLSCLTWRQVIGCKEITRMESQWVIVPTIVPLQGDSLDGGSTIGSQLTHRCRRRRGRVVALPIQDNDR